MLKAFAAFLLLNMPGDFTTMVPVQSNGEMQLAGCSGCGCRGGPGWRSKKTGKCVSDKQLRKQCGSPPSKKLCTKEN
ncbi:MAG: hypothetical protein KJ587_18255 [Alphaproteobacteria bacterium]|nr:hypothetical protein [Alphaproteobacteria bacterium]